jgi:phospholipase/lecithinase/hemolysin
MNWGSMTPTGHPSSVPTNSEFKNEICRKCIYIMKHVCSIYSWLQALYKLGARRIVVFEIGPIGCYPASLKVFTPRTKCAEHINDMVAIFNRKLHRKIEALRSQLKDATILVAEMYGLIKDMIERPSSYGNYAFTSHQDIINYHW